MLEYDCSQVLRASPVPQVKGRKKNTPKGNKQKGQTTKSVGRPRKPSLSTVLNSKSYTIRKAMAKSKPKTTAKTSTKKSKSNSTSPKIKKNSTIKTQSVSTKQKQSNKKTASNKKLEDQTQEKNVPVEDKQLENSVSAEQRMKDLDINNSFGARNQRHAFHIISIPSTSAIGKPYN